jgi:phospholipid/cholesterol/gamma-HCH transport system substrate-binding protein
LLNDGSGRISVGISIMRDFRLPSGSVAEITTATLIAGMKIQIIMAGNDTWYNSGDTIPGRVAVSIIDRVESKFDPVMGKIDSLLTGLESTVASINILLTPEFMDDIKETGQNMAQTTGSISKVAAETEHSIPELVEGINSFTSMLEENTGKLDSTIASISVITDSLAAADLAGTIKSLRESLDQTSILLAGLNEGRGSAGKIMTDDSLYINLSNSLKSLNELLIDLQENPGDYVNFSLFGGKQKKEK